MSTGTIFAATALVIAVLLVLIPISAAANVFIMGGLEHLTLQLVGVKTRSFEATLRAFCYGTAPMFCGVVPFFGSQVTLVWSLVCRVRGYSVVHKTGVGKAVAGALIPIGLCGFSTFAVMAAAMFYSAGR
jgi:hypothetical protein